ncbi:hypothetical protein QFZ77_004363 [Paenibacillus sp. V4I3]|nr:hypothetical protein [Paenibacillus sp. V4I3]MDQ0888226.1 hypothetical protein [Paenibacillus sp. V4I9]
MLKYRTKEKTVEISARFVIAIASAISTIVGVLAVYLSN